MSKAYTTLAALWFLLPAFGCGEGSPGEPEDPTPTEISLRWEYGTGSHLPLAVVPDAEGRDALYVAQKTGGVLVLDVGAEPPAAVGAVARNALGGLDAMQLVQRGNLLYVALGDFFAASGAHAGLAVIDVTDFSAPTVVGSWRGAEVESGSAVVVVDAGIAYLGAMREGIYVLDVSVPSDIRLVTKFLPDPDFPVENPNDIQHPNARGLAVAGNFLYVCDDAGGLRVIDVSDPSSPEEAGRYLNQDVVGKQQAYNSVILDGNRAFLAVDYCGFEVVDITNPEAMTRLGWFNPWSCESPSNAWINSPGHASQLAFDAGRQIVWISAGDSELLGIDVSISLSPALVQTYGERQDGLGAWGVGWSGRTPGAPEEPTVYLTYINAILPFRGTWSGVKAIRPALPSR